MCIKFDSIVFIHLVFQLSNKAFKFLERLNFKRYTFIQTPVLYVCHEYRYTDHRGLMKPTLFEHRLTVWLRVIRRLVPGDLGTVPDSIVV